MLMVSIKINGSLQKETTNTFNKLNNNNLFVSNQKAESLNYKMPIILKLPIIIINNINNPEKTKHKIT